MTVYLDNRFRCHPQGAEGLRAVNSTFFDGKCGAFIEGYRFVPEGERWVRADGVVFENAYRRSDIGQKALQAGK